jgi:hypothetical protein
MIAKARSRTCGSRRPVSNWAAASAIQKSFSFSSSRWSFETFEKTRSRVLGAQTIQDRDPPLLANVERRIVRKDRSSPRAHLVTVPGSVG